MVMKSAPSVGRSMAMRYRQTGLPFGGGEFGVGGEEPDDADLVHVVVLLVVGVVPFVGLMGPRKPRSGKWAVKDTRLVSEEIPAGLGAERRRLSERPAGRRECWSRNTAAVRDRSAGPGQRDVPQSTPRTPPTATLRRSWTVSVASGVGRCEIGAATGCEATGAGLRSADMERVCVGGGQVRYQSGQMLAGW